MNKTVITGIAAVLALSVISYLMYDKFGEPNLMKRGAMIHRALDTNADGKLDADEIEAATRRLQSMDDDNDGALSAKELKIDRD